MILKFVRLTPAAADAVTRAAELCRYAACGGVTGRELAP
jgi:hypothetical protein